MLKLFSLAIDSMDFKKTISSWYQLNKRELPWRETSNPYHIWVSEIILQQTRVVQGIGYYQRFIETFPTIFHLAQAKEDSVLKVWQGLGYYSRARNLHKGAKLVVEKYGGVLPSSYQELLKITGIGPYSAGAIASFAFKKPVPAIDGNVYRIISRIFGVFSSPESAEGKREFFMLVSELLDKNAPDSFNQALLDFGALQCVPKSPNCSVCPFNMDCYALRNNIIDSLPIKGKKITIRDRFFTYILIRFKEYTFISKRKSKDIWHSLYEFPLIETSYLPNESEIDKLPEWLNLFNDVELTITFISPVVKHLLSHQTIYSRFVVVQIDTIPSKIMQSYMKVTTNDVSNYSVPKLIDNFLAAEPAVRYFLNPPL